MNHKKLLALLISSIMFASGCILFSTYSKPIDFQNIYVQGDLTVQANIYTAILYDNSSSGNYTYEINTDSGTIAVFLYSENLTDKWNNGTLPQVYPDFNGSSGEFDRSFFSNMIFPQYLILFNPDSYAKDVSYKVYYGGSYTNYFGLATGVVFMAFGAIAIFIIVFKKKLENFNKALKNEI